MKITYDQEVDVLTIKFTDARIVDTDQDISGMIHDYDEAGNCVSIEILDASLRMPNPWLVETSVVGVKREKRMHIAA